MYVHCSIVALSYYFMTQCWQLEVFRMHVHTGYVPSHHSAICLISTKIPGTKFAVIPFPHAAHLPACLPQRLPQSSLPDPLPPPQQPRLPTPLPNTLNVSETLPRWPPLRSAPPSSILISLPLPGGFTGFSPLLVTAGLGRGRGRGSGRHPNFPADHASRAVCQHRRRCLLLHCRQRQDSMERRAWLRQNALRSSGSSSSCC